VIPASCAPALSHANSTKTKIGQIKCECLGTCEKHQNPGPKLAPWRGWLRQNTLKGLPCCCALLCAAVRCCALRVLGIGRHAHPLHDFTPSWLAAEVCPMQDKFKTQATEQVPCRRGPSESWSPAPQDGLECGQGVELIHRGVLLQVVHQQRHRDKTRPTSAARSECAALAPTPAGPENSVNGQVCDACIEWRGVESSSTQQPRLYDFHRSFHATCAAAKTARAATTRATMVRDFATYMAKKALMHYPACPWITMLHHAHTHTPTHTQLISGAQYPFRIFYWHLRYSIDDPSQL